MTTAALILALAILANGYLTRRSNERTAERVADRAEVAAREAQASADVAGRMAGIAAFDRQGVTR